MHTVPIYRCTLLKWLRATHFVAPRALIRIKAADVLTALTSLAIHDYRKGAKSMPTETAIVVAGIVLVFSAFAIGLAWASFYTRNFRAPGRSE